MKKAIYLVFSLLLLAVTFIFLVTITIPWMDDPNGGLQRPGLAILAIFGQIAIPGFLIGRALTHDEPYKYTNDFKVSMKNKDAEKFWKHRL